MSKLSSWKKILVQIITEDYARAQRKNPRFSLRAYAKSINTSVGTLSELMNGKFKISQERAAELIRGTKIASKKKNHILTLMGQKPEHREESLPAKKELLTDWVYLAVLHFFDLENVDTKPVSIASRLSISHEKAKKVVSELLDMGLLLKNPSGRIYGSGKSWRTGDADQNSVIRLHHIENLNVARRALDLVPVEQRDFTSSTLAGNSAQLSLIRDEVRLMHQRTCALAEGISPRDRLFRISVAVFPLDNVETNSHEP